jgi:hypothetical protein
MIATTIARLWRRLDRADEHLRAIELERAAVLGEYNNRVVVSHFESQTGDYIIPAITELSLDFGVLVSEFAGHMRATLDNLICALVDLRGNQPSGRTAFVVSDTPEGWTNSTTGNGDCLNGLSAGDRAIINRLQPYHRHDPPRSFAQAHPLSKLRGLSNHDKHYLMHPALAAVTFDPAYPFMRFPDWDGGNFRLITAMTVVRVDPILFVIGGDTASTELLRFQFEQPSLHRGPEVRVEFNETLDVVFGNPPSGWISKETAARSLRFQDLVDILNEVRLIVRLFEGEF